MRQATLGVGVGDQVDAGALLAAIEESETEEVA